METIKGYKAFGPGMVCRGKQYAENTVFEEDNAKICESGMHYCTEPLDVLGYYPLVDEDGGICEFAEVEDLEPTGESNSDDSKRATKRLKINGKISFAKLVNASINIESIKETPLKNSNEDSAKIGSSGDSAQIGSSGDYAKIGSSGDSAQIGSSGDYAKIGSSGYYAKIGSSGYYAKIGSSGYSAQIGSSGDYARIGSSGYSARIGSSGYSAQIGSSGDYAQIGSSGDSAQIGSSGKDAVIAAIGPGSIAKAKKGSWIVLAEYDRNGKPIAVVSKQVDGEEIKEDTFYQLKGGAFEESNE